MTLAHGKVVNLRMTFQHSNSACSSPNPCTRLHGALHHTTHCVSSPSSKLLWSNLRQPSMAAGKIAKGCAGLLAALGLLWSHWQALEVSDNASRHSLLPRSSLRSLSGQPLPAPPPPAGGIQCIFFHSQQVSRLGFVTVAILTLEHDKSAKMDRMLHCNFECSLLTLHSCIWTAPWTKRYVVQCLRLDDS